MLALGAAALFGASAPAAKLLLMKMPAPLILSGLLYLGAGLFAALVMALRSVVEISPPEAPLNLRDLPNLGAIVVLGGVVGPVLMLLGLERLSGIAGALLLNLEMPLTMVLAAAIFGEHLGRRVMLAGLSVFAGACLLALSGAPWHATAAGTAALTAACLAWALDNNLSQRLSTRDPFAVVRLKGLCAGTCTLAIGLAWHGTIPSWAYSGEALVVGSLSYGLSLVLVMLALREIGAARQATYFAAAPFIGAAISAPLLAERFTSREVLAAGLMALGVALLLREHHRHEHTHEELEHEHLHIHDEHHRHEHPGRAAEPHSHLHRHPRLTHDHQHLPDAHHRHEHN